MAHHSSLIPRSSQLFKMAVKSNFPPQGTLWMSKSQLTCALRSLTPLDCPTPPPPPPTPIVGQTNDRCINLDYDWTMWNFVLKLINYSRSSYPTRASHSGQVDGFRNPMKNELKTRPCLKRFQTRMQILYLHIDKATKTRGDKQLYFITHFTKQTLNLNYLLLTLNVMVQLLNYPIIFLNLNSRSMVAASCCGSLSTLLYTSDLKWHWR